MTDLDTLTLSTLCDGEPVDPDALDAALAHGDARAALVDFARLRASVASDESLPRSLARLKPYPAAFRARRIIPAAAAALVLLALLTASLLSHLWPLRRAEDTPPAPSRVVRYTPGVDWHPATR